tara:strand:+ start:87 stop:260 length:174 start_codon:yes stop_codon:yes gene_type:complete
MKIGDLVKHINIKNTRQVGVITAIKWANPTKRWKYKILWLAIQKEEYWFTAKELEVL